MWYAGVLYLTMWCDGWGYEMDDTLDPTTATRKYLNNEISPRAYVEALKRYVPSSATLLRSLDENPDYVARLVESLERSDAASPAREDQSADGNGTNGNGTKEQ